MVINPSLIPQSVNVVIGEGLYELKFKVELNGALGAPHPMDMDDNHEADGPGQGENNGANNTFKQITFGNKASVDSGVQQGEGTGLNHDKFLQEKIRLKGLWRMCLWRMIHPRQILWTPMSWKWR
jgi:hypothetical protein